MARYYIKQKVFKITNHYPVNNEEGKAVYFVQQDNKLTGANIQIRNQDWDHIVTIYQKRLAFSSEWVIEFKNSERMAIREDLTEKTRQMNVWSSSSRDIRLEGNIWQHRFYIFDNHHLVARIQKKELHWGDTYELTVLDEDYLDIVVSLVVTIDNVIDLEIAEKN